VSVRKVSFYLSRVCPTQVSLDVIWSTMTAIYNDTDPTSGSPTSLGIPFVHPSITAFRLGFARLQADLRILPRPIRSAIPPAYLMSMMLYNGYPSVSGLTRL
jgi:hypothetical protein